MNSAEDIHELHPIKLDKDPNVENLVIGIHEGVPMFARDSGTSKAKLNSGNLDSHVWNSSVTKQLSDIKPNILAIDGLRPSPLTESGDYSVGQKKYVWTVMPGSPRRIHEEDELTLVAGDLYFEDISRHLGLILSESLPEDQKKAVGQLFRDESGRVSGSEVKNLQLETAGELVAGLFLSGVLIDAAYRHFPAEDKLYSRRNILKSFAALTALGTGALVSGRYSIILSAYSPSARTSAIAQEVAGIFEPIFTETPWIDGRTSLMAAKLGQAEYAVKSLEDPKTALVLGNGHGYSARGLMENREKRLDAMVKLYGMSHKFLTSVLDKYPQIPRTQALNMLKEVFAKTDVIRVKDPNTNYADDVDETINGHIKYKGSFMSSEALQAVTVFESNSLEKIVARS